MSEILEGLNQQQIKAVKTTDGPLLILAGAGSGKTKTLTHRIAYLIKEKSVPPEQILAVTFTNKAANEMRERIALLLNQSPNNRLFMPFMGTFHGICVRILRQDGEHIGVNNNFVIFDQSDQLGAVKHTMRDMRINEKQYSPKAIAHMISGAKNELISVEQYTQMASTPVHKIAAQVYPKYEKTLVEASALDFDDLIGKTVELLGHEEIRDKWRRQFTHIMVDEYQDTNNAQYKLIKLLTSSKNNIAVVGDDWQSIYSWRGADFRNILNFENDYPDALVIKLEQNYRSTQAILDAAHEIISKNQSRSKKQLWTNEKGGKPVRIQQVVDEVAEGELIVGLVKSAVEAKLRKYSDFAVLYRTNAQSRSLEEACLRYGLPYRVVGGVRFYDRKEIKDVVAYLRYIYQPDDISSFLRIINVPTRGLGQKSIQTFLDWQQQQDYRLFKALSLVKECESLTKRAQTSFYKFYEMISRLRDYSEEADVAALLDAVLKRTGYLNYLDDDSIQSIERVENVKELLTVAREYSQAGLAGFLEEIALVSDIDTYDSSAEALTLMTMHSAKGLEFPVVFLAGMEESLFPHSRAMFEKLEMEEERRLCYVGMTRAKEELHLLHATRRMLYGSVQHNPPSRFISEIDSEYVQESNVSASPEGLMTAADMMSASAPTIELAEGDKVKHRIFGQGTVLSLDGDVANIEFKSRGEKKLNIAFAPIEKI